MSNSRAKELNEVPTSRIYSLKMPVLNLPKVLIGDIPLCNNQYDKIISSVKHDTYMVINIYLATCFVSS